MSEIPYKLHKARKRLRVKYACPHCREKLENELSEAGNTDICPICQKSFIVPGKRKRQEVEQKIRKQKEEAEQARKIADAQAAAEEAEAKARDLEYKEKQRKIKLAKEREKLAQKPAEPSPTAKCPFCCMDVDPAAIKCGHCQEWIKQPPAHRIAPTPADDGVLIPQRDFQPGVAAVLSLLIPGLGQIYKTQIALGVVILILTPFLYFLLLPIGFIMHVAVICDAASRSPVRK